MNSVRVALRALRFALLAALPASCLFSQTVVDDTFSDGNRTGQTPPSSVNWFVNTGATISTTTSVGSMTLSNAASRLLVGYATASGAPVTLTTGQSLTLELTFRSDVVPASVTNGFNLALFNSAGTRISGDFSGTSNAAFANYDGYGVKTSGLGSTAGSNITLRQRNAGTSTAPMSTSGDWNTLATASGTTTAAAANVDYVATFTVLNNGSTVSLSYTLKTADGVTTLQSLSGTDSSTLVTSFDTICLYFQTAEFPSGNLMIKEIKLSSSGGSAPEAPVITNSPQSQTVNVDDSVTFTVTATGTAPLSYQWAKDNTDIPGATSASYTIQHAQVSDQGSYTVAVSNVAGSKTSNPATLTVQAGLIPPSITTPPASQTVNVGDPVTFSVVASGSAPLTYSWHKGADPIPGATSDTYTILNAQTGDQGSYSVVVSNGAGSTESAAATLTVNLLAPSITKQPVSQTLGIGSSTTLSVTALGSAPLSYQWSKNGSPISGATGATLALNNVQVSDSGDYTVTVTNVVKSVTSNPATVSVVQAAGGALSRFNLTGFATVGAGTTGGGVIPESDPAYVKVTNALELANALIAAAKTAGAVKVIEIMNDLDLGWNEIGSTVQSLSSNPFRSHAAPKLHPVLLVTGMSLLDIRPKSGLTIFSANGATIRHCNFNIKGASNIIIRNLKFDEAWEWDEATKGNYDSNDWDFITLSNGSAATNIWIDHCTFTKAYDGILDQKAGTQYVTISWCKYIGDDGATNPNSWVRQQIAKLEASRASYPFYNFLRTNGFSVEDIVQIIQGHDKTHLMGSNSLDSENNTLSATFHHLWLNSMWDRCVPRLRGGNVHDYNLLVDDTNVLAAKRLRDQRAAALSSSLRNTLNSTYSFNPPINGAISTENGALLLERSIYIDCLWPLRNNQTDVTKPIYTGKIQALDTIYVFHNTDGSVVNVRGNSTDAGNPMGPFQAPVISFSWNLPDNVLPYAYTTDDPAQLPDILAEGAGAGRVVWAKQNWLKTTYVDEYVAPAITALVRHAPTVTGNVEGSIQQLLAEDVSLSNGGGITGDLLVPGTPTVQLNGAPTYGGTLDATGAATPTGYTVTLNDGTLLRHVVRRFDPVAMPSVAAPAQPVGTRIVFLGGTRTSVGDFATLRSLTLSGGPINITVPPGAYGDFTANTGAAFVLGVSGATQPAVYDFQSLTLNGGSQIKVVGPVIVTCGSSLTLNGGWIGASSSPSWLDLRLPTGSLTLSSGATAYAVITAPNGTITINSGTQLRGHVIADRLSIIGSGVLTDDRQ